VWVIQARFSCNLNLTQLFSENMFIKFREKGISFRVFFFNRMWEFHCTYYKILQYFFIIQWSGIQQNPSYFGIVKEIFSTVADNGFFDSIETKWKFYHLKLMVFLWFCSMLFLLVNREFLFILRMILIRNC
jgi:hypothetical protein